MNETRIYADAFETTFANPKEMLDFLAERAKAATWISGLAKDIYDAVVYYIMHFQDFEGNVQLQINDEDYSVALADPEQDLPNCDYFEVNKLLIDSPEGLAPDDEAIATLAAGYYVNS